MLVGLGLHRPTSPAERATLAKSVDWPILDHDLDDVVDLDQVDGVPLQVTRRVAEAERVLTVGVVELHQYAGFSGGHKGVVVGCGGRDTLAALHRRDLVCDPRVEVGRLSQNPFRDAIDALGERLGTVESALQALPDGRWVAGPPIAAHRAAAEAQDVWTPVSKDYDSVLLRVPTAKAANAYQASRAATYLGLSPAPPLRPGAHLVVDAACPEGVGRGAGEQAFAALLGSTRPPWGQLLSGSAARGAGLQRAWMLARLARRFRLTFAGCQTAAELRSFGLDATEEPAEQVAGERALQVPAPFVSLPQRAVASS